MRFRSYLTTILPANWKVVVDAFNEAYHVQGAHAQMLPWTDDMSIAYEQLGIHAHYGRLPEARRELRRARGSACGRGDYDEGEILAASSAGSAAVPEGRARASSRSCAAPRQSARIDLLAGVPGRRRELLASRGLDVSALHPDQMTSADDVYCFPNLVGPIYPGLARSSSASARTASIPTAHQGHLDARVASARRRRWRMRSGASIPDWTEKTGARSPTRTTQHARGPDRA